MSARRDIDSPEAVGGAHEQDALRRKVAVLEAELATVPELYRRLDDSLAELDSLRGAHDRLRAENERIAGLMHATWRSFSWRVTRPLRAAKSFLRH